MRRRRGLKPSTPAPTSTSDDLHETFRSAIVARPGDSTHPTSRRGEDDERRIVATCPPSAVLRAPREDDRRRMRAELIDDVRKIADESARSAERVSTHGRRRE